MSTPKSSSTRAQVVFFGHGGGPLPILGDPHHQAMLDFLQRLPGRLRRPEAIMVSSAHWEENAATLTGAANPPMLYDYYGFPPAAYEITYPAPGSPALAARIAALLEANGVPARIDPARGYDHGLFIPIKMMYPQADIPCLQLSLLRSLDAAAHIALGKALRGLLGENLLVAGSGFSFHNLRGFSWQGTDAADPANDAFQDWLRETCAAPMPESEREQRLNGWAKAPGARYCHPREEHLLPLHVCYGLAGRAGEVVFDDKILGKRNLGFLWE